jgi:prepilin-type N-terminal cleavage/methylation domain-containing protein
MKNKAFTLIELLVVIAIIGLLASIVITNLNSTRRKAEIAKSLSLSQQLKNAMSSDLISGWDFNDLIGGNTIKDVSGSGNDGTVYGGAVLADSLVFSGGNLGKAINLDGNDDYVDINIFPQPLYEITMTAWIFPKTSGSGLIIKRNHCDGITVSGSNVGYSLKRSDHSSDFLGASGIQQNQWNFIAAGTSLKTRKMFLFINGNYYSKSSLDDSQTLMGWSANDSIGKGTGSDPNCPDGTAFNGLIDEVWIYGQALSYSQLHNYYVKEMFNRELSIK